MKRSIRLLCAACALSTAVILPQAAVAADAHANAHADAHADAAGEALARSKDCFYCHDTTGKQYGPSFKEVARRYKNLKNADILLAGKIKSGGTDHFGTSHFGAEAMPPDAARVKVTDAEAEQLAKWVLTQD